MHIIIPKEHINVALQNDKDGALLNSHYAPSPNAVVRLRQLLVGLPTCHDEVLLHECQEQVVNASQAFEVIDDLNTTLLANSVLAITHKLNVDGVISNLTCHAFGVEIEILINDLTLNT